MKNKLKIKELRKLPHRKWGEVKRYRSILLINSGRKHDSGFALIYIIGIEDDEPKEIAASCDDINWLIKQQADFYLCGEMRTDMYYPSGIIRMWSNEFDFEVGVSVSSVKLKLVKRIDFK